MSNPAAAEGIRFDHIPDVQLKDAAVRPQAVAEMEYDAAQRQAAMRFIGDILMRDSVEVQTVLADAEPHTSLLEALQSGNRALVRANAWATMIEIALKAGHVTEVILEKDAAGHIHQHGQSLKSVQANTLVHGAAGGKMYGRFEAETTNTFRMEALEQAGLLEDNWLVFFSQTDTEMSLEELDEAHFFTDTMSLSAQGVTARDGQLVMETAFVAGTTEPGGERHDSQFVEAIGDFLGIDFRGMNSTERLNYPVLIPKSMMPGGMSDLVAIGDRHLGTFFGQAKPVQDYATYRQECRDREIRFEPNVDDVADALMAADDITTEMDAVLLLTKLAGSKMLQQAMMDSDIDPSVFGPEAKEHIIQGRQHFAEGNYLAGLAATAKAEQVADYRDCPWFQRPEQSASNTSASDTGACEFTSKECPLCHAKNVKTVIKSVRIRGRTKTQVSGACGCSKIK